MVTRNEQNTMTVTPEILRGWQKNFPKQVFYKNEVLDLTNRKCFTFLIDIDHCSIALERSRNAGGINNSYVSFIFAYRHPETKEEKRIKLKGSRWIDRYNEVREVARKSNQFLADGKDPKSLFDNFKQDVKAPDKNKYLVSTLWEYVLIDLQKAGVRAPTLKSVKSVYNRLGLQNKDIRDLNTLYFQNLEINHNQKNVLNKIFDKALELDLDNFKKPVIKVTQKETEHYKSFYDSERDKNDGLPFTYELAKSRLLDNIESLKNDRPDEYFVLWVIMFTLLRIESVMSIRVRDIDFKAEMITIPADNMKYNKTFRFPMQSQLKQMLTERIQEKGLKSDDRLYPKNQSTVRYHYGKLPCSKIHNPHGARASFCDFVVNILDRDPKENIFEECLSHVTGTKVDEAYCRSDRAEKRRSIMQQWADFLTGQFVKSDLE